MKLMVKLGLAASVVLLLQGLSIAWASTPTNIAANDAETDGVNGFTELNGARSVATFTVATVPYAIVTGELDNGVQIINLSDPTNIIAVDAETDGANGFTELQGARGVAIFTVATVPYAIVASDVDDGVQIINLSDPSNITAADAETDGVNGFTELNGATGVATFTVATVPYAIVVSDVDDGVQIINLSDPSNITAVDAETDGVNGFTELDGPIGVATFTVASVPYAIVTSDLDNGVQIINLGDPSNITAADAETDGVNGFTALGAARGVATFTVATVPYAIVTSLADDAVQIINLSDPSNIAAVDAETDGANGFTQLDGATAVAIFTVSSVPYAIVASIVDDGVQVIDLSDPSNITAADAETDEVNGFTELDGAAGAAVFIDTLNGSTNIIVPSQFDDGVQIITVDGPVPVELQSFSIE
ncbi:MAG: hypothetical protein KDC35_18010 [Acidobacteria bacterium]|nr:hypothetical protein [Acidobacteriota bacterium]